jgi:hypothetical protein
MSCEDNNGFLTNYVDYFDKFLVQLKVTFSNSNIQDILDEFKSYSNEQKIELGVSFNNSLNASEIHFDSFVKSKIKVFSSKNEETNTISNSLFKSTLSLKDLLNNQSDEIKEIIWSYLHIIYLIIELSKPVERQNKTNINKLNSLLYNETETEDEEPQYQTNTKSQPNPQSKSQPKQVFTKMEDMLGLEVNDETSKMMNEIVTSFESMMNVDSNVNPINHIIQLSQSISEKYTDKIKSGEIEAEKIMKTMCDKIPGMNMIFDSVMKDNGDDSEPNEIANMMGSLLGGAKNMFGGGNDAKNKEKVIIDENFSTADVSVVPIKESKSKFKIGSALKMADAVGIIPGGKKKDGAENPLGGLMSGLMGNLMGGDNTNESTPDMSQIAKMFDGSGGEGMPDMSGLMKMFEGMSGDENAEDIQKGMNSFFEKQFGIDMSKLDKDADK